MNYRDLPEAERQILLSASQATEQHDKDVRRYRAVITTLALLGLALYFFGK